MSGLASKTNVAQDTWGGGGNGNARNKYLACKLPMNTIYALHSIIIL